MASQSTPTDISPVLIPIISFLSSTLEFVVDAFHRIPGSPILVRYVKSSYQDDPWRSALELLLFAYALRTVLMGRTRGEGEGGKLKLSEKVRRRRHFTRGRGDGVSATYVPARNRVSTALWSTALTRQHRKSTSSSMSGSLRLSWRH